MKGNGDRSTHPPEDLMQHPGHLLRRALQTMNLLWDQEVSHTITSPQFAALNALYREPRLDQGTLGQRISLDRSTMAEVVSRLGARGLISTERDTRDGRRKKITLTPKGLYSLQQLIPRTRMMTERLVGPLDAKERSELLRLLSAVVKANEQLQSTRKIRLDLTSERGNVPRSTIRQPRRTPSA
ncbi:MAG: MarR family transcriptional regulator [Chloroflexi bacterium]|nr:MAG: MarR family transcriptional regulator [Chloroflexota bacterium]